MSEYDDIVVDITRRQESARAQTIGGFDVTADDAARAVELGRSTGQDPNVLAADLKGFDEAHKRNMATAIIRQNLHLADYTNANPINAKLSQDDWGTLDKVSSNLTSFRRLSGYPTRTAEGMIGAAAKGFQKGFGEGPIGSWLRDEDIKNHPLASAVYSGVLAPVEGALRALSGGMHGATEAVKAGAKESYQTFTGDEQGAERFSRDIAGMVEMQLQGTGVHSIQVPAKMVEKAWRELDSTKLWLDHGVEPPPGLSREIDRIKKKQNDADVANLDEMLSDAQRSTTRERDPDTFAEFIRMRDEGTIGIDADAILKIYGDKVPHPEDGLLGWSPEIVSQLEVARRVGGDIEIPVADWLARVDPEIAKALHDDIRVRPGGITKNEAKGLSEAQQEMDAAHPKIEGEAPIDSPKVDPAAREIIPDDLPQIRAAGGLEPMFAIGDRQLKIEKRERSPEQLQREVDTGRIPADEFRLLDETGRKVGQIDIVPFEGGKRLYVDSILGFESLGFGPNAFGPSLTRSILRQLKEAYPEATEIGGFRISGARERAGTEKEAWIKFDVDDVATAQQFREGLAAKWQAEGGGVESLRRRLTAKETQLEAALREEAKRIVPDLDVEMVASIFHPEGTGVVKGVYLGAKTLISLEAGAPANVLRHEAIHHLYRSKFFTEGEWGTLERAAREEGWVARFNIDKRYPNLSNAAKLEEAIAEGYNYWKSGELILKDTGAFQKLKDFFEALLRRFKEALGEDFTWEQLFKETDEGRIGRRVEEAPEGRMEPAFSQDAGAQPSPRDTFRTPASVGMTEPQMRLYERRLREMHEQDVEWTQAKAEKEARRRLTAEWKAEYKTTHAEVEATMLDRPDVAADMYLARGEYFGNKIAEKVKLNFESLTPEQRAALPKDYITKEGKLDGVAPDDLAAFFGYHNGQAMLDSLMKWNAAKLSANMSTKAFLSRMVEMETERQMKAKLGDLEENILDQAKDQVAGETQLNLLAEETLLLGIKAGKSELPINKAEYKSWFAERFGEMPLAGQTSDKYLRAAQKSGTAAELELLRGNFDGAFRAKQQQFGAMLLFRDARQLEKEHKAFDKLVKKLTKREVKGLDQDFMDYTQALLWQAGVPVRRSMPEIQRSMEQGGFTSFDQFVESKRADGWDPAVSPDLAAGNVTPLEQMTVGQFREYKDAVDSLNYIGRLVNKIEVEGQKRDFADLRDEIVSNVKTLPRREPGGQGNWFYRFDAALTRTEEMVKDLDLRKELGPLFNFVIRPMVASKAKEYTMLEKLGADLRALKVGDNAWQKTLKDTIPQDFFVDPLSNVPFDLTRQNLLHIMLNWGNRSNIEKFTKGYGSKETGRPATKEEAAAFEVQMKGLIDRYATRDDWRFVQGIWDIFAGYRKDIDTLWRNTSGVQPKFIEPAPITTPVGEFAGGYYPIIYDPIRSGISVAKEDVARPNTGLFGENYFRAATGKSYLKSRTGHVDPIDISAPLESIATRMQQMVHDIAFRDAVMSASKVIYDKQIRSAIRNHYGKEYEDQFVPWLKRVANNFNADDKAVSAMSDILRRMRLNLVGHALPFNLKVLLSPDVGAPTPKTLKDFYTDREGNMSLAMAHSKEIPHAIYNIDRDFREQLDSLVAKRGFSGFQKDAIRWGFAPIAKVSQEFRAITFVDKFRAGKAKGLSDAEAALVADSAVRERHSSASVVDLPAIMQGSEGMRLMTMFYGYFNTMYNWQRQIPNNLRRGEWKKAWENYYGSVLIGSLFGAALFTQQKEDDSWGKVVAKAMIQQPLGTIPFARDVANYFIEGIPSRTPLATGAQAVSAVASDIRRYREKKPLKHPIQDVANVLGTVVGVPGMAQIGRTGQFSYDAWVGKQRPRNIGEWARGIITGEARLKRSGER